MEYERETLEFEFEGWSTPPTESPVAAIHVADFIVENGLHNDRQMNMSVDLSGTIMDRLREIHIEPRTRIGREEINQFLESSLAEIRESLPHLGLGLSRQEVARLPIETYREKEEDEEGEKKGESTVTDCCICLAEVKNGSVIRRIQCNHIMHKDCMDRWLERSVRCPLCRTNLRRGSS